MTTGRDTPDNRKIDRKHISKFESSRLTGADLENFKTASLLKLKRKFRAARAFRY